MSKRANHARETATVFVQPRLFGQKMDEDQLRMVDHLVSSFNEQLAGWPLFVGAQALGILTADYCAKINERGGDTLCALQDVAARGQEWISAGEATEAVLRKAGARMRKRRSARRLTTRP